MGITVQENIRMARVDNRLVHGQVVAAWIGEVRANLIVVANDVASTDEVRQKLMTMAANGTALRFFSIQKTIDVIAKASPKQQIMLVVETPQDALRLVEGGVGISKLNIGNMHMSDGKRQVHPGMAIDDADVVALSRLVELGVSVSVQRIPGESAVDVSKFI